MTFPDQEKYVVCDALDADVRSRSATARSVRDAEALLNGLRDAGRAFGATQAFVCVNAGDAKQAAAIEAALEKTGDGFEVHVVPVAASLVLQDEGTLLRVLEGRQAIPHVTVPPSAPHTLRGRPVEVVGVEALVRRAQEGPETKMLTVAWQGEVRVVEVEPGITLRAAVLHVTGEDPGSEGIKAVCYGGATGRFYDGAGLDTPLASGDGRPRGVIEIIPAGTCGVELVREMMRHLSEESCGACVACREGTRQLADILDDVAACRAEPEVLELLEELADALETGSICDLGKYAAAPLRSSLELFPADYRAHLDHGRCPGDRGCG